MSAISDTIKTAQDKDGMLRRALERIIQLYTDKSHFVYELLQNAEDCEATSIKFVQFNDRLEVYHNGKPFTSENLQGLCDIGKSDKVDNLNQIGEFGVGFKSVFGICDTVYLYSNPGRYNGTVANAVPFAVEICDFTRPEDIPEESISGDYTTKFVFPYTVGRTFSGFKSIDKLNTVLAQKLQNLGITTLLFMKHLELIEYKICTSADGIEGEYLLQKEAINSHCSLVSALGMSATANDHGNKDEEISYLKFSRTIDESSGRTVDIAFPVSITKDGQYDCQRPKSPYVSVYFPTETESKLNFIVQGPYRTTPNRSSIPSDESDNIMLARKTATLLHDSLLELRDAGKLNMSFLKALPVTEGVFYSFDLFHPLYETVMELFSEASIIPCKDGGYTKADNAKIARQEKLAQLLPDSLLSQLINDGEQYHWLPSVLTETNREYEQVYRFLNSELGISVIRPDDLRQYFESNRDFLPQMDDKWIVSLYAILENVGAAFSKSGSSSNMLTASIVKTTKGEFVAPYRRTEGRQYIPNVFLPSNKVRSDEINFVDPGLYMQCRHFFDDILELQKPNEYECQINDIKKRYSGDYVFDEEQHIFDMKFLLKYLKYDEYRSEVFSLIRNCFLLRCVDSSMKSTYSEHLYVPINSDGINIEGYFRNIYASACYVDVEFYADHNISLEDLLAFEVRESILTGDTITHGIYSTGSRGRQPEWNSSSDFRWKLSIDGIKNALTYISSHPSAKDSILKSQAIFRILLLNEKKLRGNVFLTGSTPNLGIVDCDLVKLLRGESFYGWDGKWLFTEDGELVSQKSVSKHDISEAIYGKLKVDSIVYELLGFKKTDDDTVDELKKKIPEKQLDAYFETELKRRFGVTSSDLSERYGSFFSSPPIEDEVSFPFPTSFVKNWEALKKHAAEMLCYANPVQYEYAVRHIRVSNHAKEARAYLHNMYRYDGVYKYACQSCHDSCGSIEIAQLFNNPETELDPMNLCLCPTCAGKYRLIRNNNAVMSEVKRHILESKEDNLSSDGYVSLLVGDLDIWFTQTHFAEIKELLRLEEEVNRAKKSEPVNEASDTESDDQSGLSVYAGYVGKYISRKTDGFGGVITKIDDKALYVAVDAGKDKGQSKQIMLDFFLKSLNSAHPLYELSDAHLPV